MAVLVISDGLSTPEVVTYTGVSGSGPYTLTGVERGQCGSTAHAWGSGAEVASDVVSTLINRWEEHVTAAGNPHNTTLDDLGIVPIPVKALGDLADPVLHAPLVWSTELAVGSGSITSQRATTATYVDRGGIIRTAAINAPRFESAGLLIEGASSNSCLYSADFSAAAWLRLYNCAVQVNTRAAPDGTTNADTLVFDGTQYGQITQSVAGYTIGTTVTISVYALADTQGATFAVWCAGVYLGDMAPTSTWRRYQWQSTLTGTTASLTIVSHVSARVYVWGAQIEVKHYATSYIQTSDAPVTRAADLIYLSSDNWPVDSYTVVVDVDHIDVGHVGGHRIYQVMGATNQLFGVQAGSGALVGWHNSTTPVTSSPTILQAGLTYRAGYVVDGYASQRVYLDGVLVGAQSGGAPPSGSPYIVYLGSNSSTIPLDGHLRNLRIYDRALSADVLRIA